MRRLLPQRARPVADDGPAVRLTATGALAPAPAWALHRIEQLQHLLAAKDRLIATLEVELKQAKAAAAPPPRRTGIAGPMRRHAACDDDRHLVAAINADREQVERVNDRLRAERDEALAALDELREAAHDL